MSMKNQKGIVKYQDRDDIVCSYGIRDDNKQFYYLDVNDGKPFKNGNRIATTALVEAVDPMVKASNIGLIDPDGKEIIPFNNRSIRPVNDDIILVEPATPVTQSVIDAIQLKSDPLSATKLVSTPALIKEKLNAKVGADGRYLFNDQFSEATVCDINGNNLVNNERYSFIVSNGKELLFSKNTADSDITNYSILPPEVQSDVTAATETQAIDVSNIEVPTDVVENALKSDVSVEQVAEPTTSVDSTEINPPVEGAVQESPVSVENTAEKVEEGNTFEEPVQSSNMENGFEIPKVSIDIPTIPEGAFSPVSANNNAAKDMDSISADNEVTTNETSVSNEGMEESIELPFDTVSSASGIEEPLHEENEVDASSEIESNDAPIEDIFSNPIIPDKIEDSESEIEEKLDTDLDSVESEEAENSDDLSILDVDSDINESEEQLNSSVFGDDLKDNNIDDLQEFSSEEDDVEDSIVSDIDIADTFDDSEFKYSNKESEDNIMADVAKSMTAMMNRIKALEAELSEEQAKNGKLASSRRTLVEKNKMLGKKVEILTNKNSSLGATISKAQSTNNILENRVHEQKRVIDAQSQELQMLRPLLHDKEKVVGILADAQALLDDGISHRVR